MREDLFSAEKITRKERCMIVLIAFFCVTICSKSSPLYPFNNWYDADCFFTVGKAVANHRVMYRDIYEQKGPLLYFLFSFAYLISNNSFVGVYLLELLFGAVFLLISYQTLRLFSGPGIITAMPIAAAVIYGSNIFASGSSAEEFCLPLIAWGCFVGLKSLKRNKQISCAECFAIGAAAGALLWIKYSLLGFYFGFELFFLYVYLKNKWIRDFFRSAAALMAGAAAVSLPILCYFIVNGALSDLWEVYFYNIIFVYSENTGDNLAVSTLVNLFWGLGSFVKHFFVGILIILSGLVWYLIRKQKQQFLFLLITAVSLFFFIYAGGRRYIYYSLPLTVFVPFGILPMKSIKLPFAGKLLSQVKKSRATAAAMTGALILACGVALYAFSPNTYFMKYHKEDLPQYQFAAVIKFSEHPTLLNYGFLDGGFYMCSDILPANRFFCELNIPLEEMREEQENCLNNQTVKFVVSIFPLDERYSDKYQCVCTAVQERKHGEFCTYYLYRSIESDEVS